MQDRLADLRQAVSAKCPSLLEQLPPRMSAVLEVRRTSKTDLGLFEAHVGGQTDEGDAGFMAEYLAQINDIKAGIAKIDEGGEQVKALKQQMIQTATPAEEKRMSNELQRILRETNVHVLGIRGKLEVLKQENDVYHSKHPNSSESRIRENMHAAITRKFREQLTDYQTLQTEYKKSVKDKIERQIRIVYPETTDHEMQEIVQSGDTSVVQQQIFSRMTGAHESLQFAYEDIQAKHRDVKRLEQGVAELHQMFVDLAALVDQQGQLLDQVDYAVKNAADYTEKADKDLVVAQKLQTKRRKWGCYLSCCIIVVVLMVVLPLVVFLTK